MFKHPIVSGFKKELHPCSVWFYNNIGAYSASYLMAGSITISTAILRELIRWMTGKMKPLYSDYYDLIDLTEEMFSSLATEMCGSP